MIDVCQYYPIDAILIAQLVDSCCNYCVITYIIVLVVHMDHLVVLIVIVGGWTNHINQVGGRPVFSTTISVSVTVTVNKKTK